MGHSVPTQGVQQQTQLQKSRGKMQLGRASARCVKQSLAQQKSVFLAALATSSEVKHSLEGQSCLHPWGKDGDRRERQPPASDLAAPGSLLSERLRTLNLSFLEVLRCPFFPEPGGCENTCHILSSHMLCFLLIKRERREQTV